MGSNYWSLIKLKDLSIDGKGIYGLNAPAVPYNPNLFKYLRITDIKDDGTLDYENMTSVDDMSSYKYILKDNDIVFARTGNSTGRSYLYDKRDGTLVYAGYLIKFSLDEKKVNPKYVKYYTLTDDYKGWVNSFATGSTRNSINAKIYGDMEIKVPRREVQDRIVSILDCIENKIRYSNHIILVLESIAKAIYNEWFVNFNFPDENGLPYKDNGGEFVDSELGKIPVGWNVGKLDDIIIDITSGVSTKVKSELSDDIYKYPVIGASRTMAYSNDYNIDSKVLIIGRVGTLGVVQRINEKVWATDNTLIVNTSYYEYVYNILKTLDYKSLNRGSTQPLITRTDIRNTKIIIPNEQILTIFENLLLPFSNQIENCIKETKVLDKIKNILLSKLMSGQIDVDKLNIDWDKLDKTLKEVENLV